MNLISRYFRWRLLALSLTLLPLVAAAETVHVYTARDLNGTVSTLTDVTVDTGTTYSPAAAAAVSGYIFTGWTISASQSFVSRDHYGRSLEAVSFKVYEQTTLTAHYLPKSLDTDADGLPDGWELYWFGDLGQTGRDDSDGDGYAQVVEYALGTNPHLVNRNDRIGVISAGGSTVTYNPSGIATLTIRSEPEGRLFSTTREFVKAGTVRTTSSYNPNSSQFAYWTVGGARQQDHRGRAVDAATFTMPPEDLEVVAHCVTNVTERKVAYWYGTATTLDSDTDGDGYNLAVELALGTNPLLPDRNDRIGVISAAGTTVQYNPDGIHSYTIRSNPAGRLFATRSDFAKRGTVITTATCNPQTSDFAYWTINGVRQADRRGRALDTLAYVMGDEDVDIVAECITTNKTVKQVAYWYGTDIPLDSDTDGDGYTLAVELALGTNPLLPNRTDRVGVISAAGTTRELNLQVYEQVQGTVISEAFEEMFTSYIAGNASSSMTFANGEPVWPVVADLNGDALFDIVVLSEKTTNVYVNVGSSGNPEFEIRTDVDLSAVDLEMNTPAKLASFTLDVPTEGALSATTNGTELLVSDVDGRIWYYTANRTIEQSEQSNNLPIGQSLNRTIEQSEQSNNSYTLQHKVWGGSYAGFANGLRLAAVDWEDDGDLDCLCGTAEGKLMLLRNPKVGRPTNLAALAGVDSVQLSWDPNAQSRIRGYRVYRAEDGGDAFTSLVSPYTPLPFYRDTPSIVAAYNYRVTSVSRFYTAGNSTPIESESMPTEAVRAVLGTPTFTIGEPVRTAEGTIEITVSINNSLHYRAAGTEIRVPYNVTDLVYASTRPSGLSEKLVYHTTTASGVATIAITSGEVEPGSGAFFTLVFHGTADAVLKGDLDGDGRLTELDIRLLAKLKSAAGRKYTDLQLKAGDLNGNGKLDNADYQALRALLKEQGVL